MAWLHEAFALTVICPGELVAHPTHALRCCRSRLGCQIKCSKELEGMKLRIPSATRNMAVDGFVPKPH